MIGGFARIEADEVIARLDQLPRKVRGAIRSKMVEVLAAMKPHLFEGLPGKYLNPNYIQFDTTEIGSTLIGFIEVDDRDGQTYPIVPKTAAFLQFRGKDGTWVRTKHVNHPFLKASPSVLRLFEESKPWIVDQLEDAAIEAL